MGERMTRTVGAGVRVPERAVRRGRSGVERSRALRRLPVPRIKVEGQRGSRLSAMDLGARALVGRVAANGSKFPPFGSVREANACSSPHSVAMRPRVAARSSMSGASSPATKAQKTQYEGRRSPEYESWSSNG
jgi:hypothetical protein